MANGLSVRCEAQIPAPPATVFAFLIDPDKLMRWIGSGAEMEAHPGGLYLLKDVALRRTARGTFREVVPVHRLAYSFGWDNLPEMPPDSSLVEIDLIERDGGTLLRLTHTGLPNEAERDGHEKGWRHYLDRLAVAAAGGTLEPDRGQHLD